MIVDVSLKEFVPAPVNCIVPPLATVTLPPLYKPVALTENVPALIVNVPVEAVPAMETSTVPVPILMTFPVKVCAPEDVKVCPDATLIVVAVANVIVPDHVVELLIVKAEPLTPVPFSVIFFVAMVRAALTATSPPLLTVTAPPVAEPKPVALVTLTIPAATVVAPV